MSSHGYKLVRPQLEDKLHVQVGVVLEYVMGLMGPLVLGLIRDKGRLLRGQVSLA